jgi:hypothetical protein
VVDPAQCYVDALPATTDAGDDGGAAAGSCPYGPTMFGTVGDDDDCKYHLTWSSTDICRGGRGVEFTITAVYRAKTSGGMPVPLTGAHTRLEVFTTTPGDPDAAGFCDDQSTHLAPALPGQVPGSIPTTEGPPPGTYVARVEFDQPGKWTVRFHFNDNCADIGGGSPHGHAAFQVVVP